MENECLWCEEDEECEECQEHEEEKSSKSLASSNMKRNKGGENMDDIRDTLRVAGLFAAGVLIGTVCGLLLAPMSGAEMRE